MRDFFIMLRIGITGGIGSGKTTVCSIFQELNIPVYSADQRAKELMVESAKLREKISSLFGSEAYSDNVLNRIHIAEQAFQNPDLLQQLNDAVHPAVVQDFDDWARHQEEEGQTYVLKEAALMYESGSYKDLDAVITVSAPESLRIERSMKRDGVSRDKIVERLNKQWTEDQRLEKADYVIVNDGQEALIPQVLNLHKQFSA